MYILTRKKFFYGFKKILLAPESESYILKIKIIYYYEFK